MQISIHTPRMGSDVPLFLCDSCYPTISIHTPRMGSDGIILPLCANLSISIHTPRMGSDDSYDAVAGKGTHFNPHSPHGE